MSEQKNFIEQMIERDVAAGTWGEPGDRSVVRTRFPPEPNGFLHIGHTKSICLNFGLAEEYGGACNLRFDDTNPVKEEDVFVRSIVEDVRWMGFRWQGASEDDSMAGVLFASDYFEQLHEWAVDVVGKGLAYVDDQSAEEIRVSRGTLTEPGRESACRSRSVEENLDLFARMTAGEFADGSRVLRAKIDMGSPNLNLRDPVMYRILHAKHHRTGDRWCVYPMYDWAHGQEDAIEGITHSLCTLEFENHRPLYEWFLRAINQGRVVKVHEPRQTEFARLAISYTDMSKRRLRRLVEEGFVEGWDDPRMATISGYRRRGATPEAIRAFSESVGVTKTDSVIDMVRLENAMRDDLNARAPRRMCVLRPLKVTITNWGDGGDEGRTEWLDAVNNPEDAGAGSRQVPFTKTLYIERDDFLEDPPKKFFRLRPGGEVRLRYGYWVTCTKVIKDAAGEVTELECTYDPQTRGGDAPAPDAAGNVRKVKGTLHWVSAEHAAECEVRLFDRLFNVEIPARKPKDAGDDWDFTQNVNPNSLEVVERAHLEPNWRTSATEIASGTGRWSDGVERFQFERLGYFCVDVPNPVIGAAALPGLVFNRTVTLKDSWAKVAGQG
jgi:glutaminyl-tRNA synthetase